MCVPGAWRLSAAGVPVPPPSSDAECHTEIMQIHVSLLEDARQQPRYAADNQSLWKAYFQRCPVDQLMSINDTPVPRGRLNSDNRHQWWCVPGRTLLSILEYIEGGNETPLEYRTQSFSHRSKSSR
ncbi:Homeobox protein KNOX3 [Hordeum vulgare]|nr:Homeobox protein KNOX3 [Hordeum vulgare]